MDILVLEINIDVPEKIDLLSEYDFTLRLVNTNKITGPVKGFNNEEVQNIITKKHDSTQNKIAKEDAETATFAAGQSIFVFVLKTKFL